MDSLIRTSDILMLDASMKNKSYTVSDVILSHNGNINGLIITGKGLFGIKHIVPQKNILRITKTGCIINGYKKYKLKTAKSMRYASSRLIKKKVMSQNGIFMGMVSDFYINSQRMQVVAVEVAKSFFEDLFTGRTLIPGNIIAGEGDSIIITDIQVENKLHNTKGLINAIDDGLKRT